MKKITLLIGAILLFALQSFSQLTVNQSVTPTTGLKVGDTISVKYTVARGTTHLVIFG